VGKQIAAFARAKPGKAPGSRGQSVFFGTRSTLILSHPGANMTVKIDEVEPNIFPHVDDLDAGDASRHVEVFLDVSIEGNHTPVTVKLSYEQASDLAILLEPFRKP
jgi:hypothetical protein